MLDEVRVASKDAEERLKRARWVESEAERLREQYEQTLRRIKEEEERTGADIGLKIRDDLERVAEESRRLYDELRFAHKPLARRMRDIHEGLREVLQKTEELLSGHRPERPIKAGDEVYVVKVHKWGEVARVDNQRKRALVNVGEMQMELDLSELVPWGSEKGKAKGTQ
jgi:dsDNA-specific endonuclease/ATPase MutS2